MGDDLAILLPTNDIGVKSRTNQSPATRRQAIYTAFSFHSARCVRNTFPSADLPKAVVVVVAAAICIPHARNVDRGPRTGRRSKGKYQVYMQ
jgi:hypothetical protein